MAQPRTSSLRPGREIYPPSVHKDGTEGSSQENPPHLFWFKWDLTPSEWDILLVSTCIKLLLFPA
jgi:alpha-1,3-glucosyltransferase